MINLIHVLASEMWEFFWQGRCLTFCKVTNVFAFTYPSRPGVGAIDNSNCLNKFFTYTISSKPLKNSLVF